MPLLKLPAMLAAASASLLLISVMSSPAHAVNCSLSYYCYRSMTPGPAPETSTTPATPVRVRTAPNGDRLVTRPRTPRNRPNASANQNEQQRLAAERRAQQQREQQQRLETQRRARLEQQREQQRLAAERRAQQQREQQQRLEAQRRAQLEQQRQEAQRRAQSEQQRTPQNNHRATPTVNPPTAAVNRTPSTEEQRLAAERRALQQAMRERNRNQAQATPQPTTPTPPASNNQAHHQTNPRGVLSANTTETNAASCNELIDRQKEVERDAIIAARERRRQESQVLFRAAAELRLQARRQSCPLP